MARPSKFDRNEALDVVTETIRTGGYEQASVKALSERLGITRSSFYNAFGSREVLFAEVVARYSATAPDAPLYGEVTGPVLPVLHAVLRNICHVRTADPEGRGCIIVNSISELCPAPEGPAPLLTKLATSSTSRIEELLRIGRHQGEIDNDADIHALALALQNLMIGLNVLSKVVRDEGELWLLTETTLRGLGLFPPKAPKDGN
ncbi:TetR/AcrR family transcriptional regulator [Rhizobium leguminosarum]|uniref:TetR/AcrR family transcriptional regulator n=1 Tax=Rhizobium leguminosarum TaxID=384 RepID=UPI003F9C8209